MFKKSQPLHAISSPPHAFIDVPVAQFIHILVVVLDFRHDYLQS